MVSRLLLRGVSGPLGGSCCQRGRERRASGRPAITRHHSNANDTQQWQELGRVKDVVYLMGPIFGTCILLHMNNQLFK